MNEIWKDVVGYEGYYKVSNLGRVKSLIRKGVRKERILIPKIKRNYPAVHLCVDSVNKHPTVHRLVANSFIKNPENKPYVNHINGNKLDFRAENLEWVTESENIIHAFNQNLHSQKGEKNAASVLTEKDVLNIKKLLVFHKPKVVAEKLNIALHNVYSVRNGKNWSHVNGGIK